MSLTFHLRRLIGFLIARWREVGIECADQYRER